MSFAGISYTAVLVAAIASYVFGAVWYMALSKQWIAALDKTEAEFKSRKPSAVPFIIAFVAQLVMAVVLAGIIGHLGPPTPKTGLITAGLVYIGFVLTTLVTNHGFQGNKPSLTVIDGLHWLGVLMIQGLVIGLIGV